MQYEVRTAAIEAERVLLSGQNLYAVAVEGKAHLVPGEVFDLFFALRDAVAGMKAAVKPGPVKPKAPTTKRVLKRVIEQAKAASARPLVAPKPGLNQYERSAELRSIVLKALAEVGPLTTAELGDRCYPASDNAKARYQGAWCVLKKLAEEHLVEKRDDLKWHLKTK